MPYKAMLCQVESGSFMFMLIEVWSGYVKLGHVISG